MVGAVFVAEGAAAEAVDGVLTGVFLASLAEFAPLSPFGEAEAEGFLDIQFQLAYKQIMRRNGRMRKYIYIVSILTFHQQQHQEQNIAATKHGRNRFIELKFIYHP